MTTNRNFYVTTAISYPNGTPHIGHAYELVATDVIARFYKLDGCNVFFLTGTDEHGIKMLQTAREQDIPVRELANRNAAVFEQMVDKLACSPDRFIRTTEEAHHRSCQEIWRRMEANGDIYLDSYSGWYSVRDEAYYDESETIISEDGTRLGPQGTPVTWVDEESYFFRLSAYADKLLDLYTANPDFIGPKERRNEIVNFVKSGLRDLSVSRTTFDWGVKVPGNDKHVMYVWVDALTNYLTGLGFPDDESENLKMFWPADLHVIGKDITRFHAIYWPAFLMSAGIRVPKRVFGHGFVLNKGTKMSKSVGNVLDPFDLADHYGVDQIRYFLVREVPFGQDGSYSHEAIVNRTNADLANDLGNLAQRSLSMIYKNCDGRIPTPGDFTPEDQALLNAADGLLDKTRDMMGRQELHLAVAEIWRVVADANRYFASEEPWALKKTDPTRMHTVLYVTAETLRILGIMSQFVTLEGSSKLLILLNIGRHDRSFSNLSDRLVPGTAIEKPTAIFPRYVEEEQVNAG